MLCQETLSMWSVRLINMLKLELGCRFMHQQFPEEVPCRGATLLKRHQQVFGLICLDRLLPLRTLRWSKTQLTFAKHLCPSLAPPPFLFIYFFIEVKLVYNIIYISGVQHNHLYELQSNYH